MSGFCNNNNYLINGLFTVPSLGQNNFKNYSNNEVKGWIINDQGQIINNSSKFPIPYPCGSQAYVITSYNFIEQTFKVNNVGTYTLIIHYAGADCKDKICVGNSLNIFLNNEKIHTIIEPSNKSWNHIMLDINITNDTNKLKIAGTSINHSTAIQLILTDQIIQSNQSNKTIPIEQNINNMNYSFNESSIPVYIIGNYGIAPWGMNTNFPDLTAKWIWYSEKSNIKSPNNQSSPITIQYIYSNKSNNVIDGILNVIVDNSCEIFLNSTELKKKDGTIIKSGWNQGNDTWNILPFKILPGNNLFEFKTFSTDGPGGLIACAKTINTNELLFHTDETWKFIPLAYKPITSCNLSQIGLITTIDKSFPWGCLSLNGTSQYVDIGKTISGMEGLSFGCWFKSNNNKNLTNIIDFGNDMNNNIKLYIINNAIGCCVYLMNNTFDNIQKSLTQPINDNKWYHIVWTIQKTDTGAIYTIHLNNKIVSTTIGSYPINMERTKCYIGKTNSLNNPNYFSGFISNFVMYQKVLSINEIDSLYLSMINLMDPKLYIYLPFSTNAVLDTLLNNYANKPYSLPIKNENWTCMEQNNKWINVKMENNTPMCMSMDGKTCIETTQPECKKIITNPVVPFNPIICSETQNGWCVDAKKHLIKTPPNKLSTNEIESLVLKSNFDSKLVSTEIPNSLIGIEGTDKILSFINPNMINDLMIGGIFKLRVNLPYMPPYIKGQPFDINKGINPNFFYLAIEKLDNNCNIKTTNNNCIQTFADNKNCNIKALTSNVKSNTFRLVLVSSKYVKDTSISIGKNSDWTLIKANNQIYLKNVQTGYLPCLYTNDSVLSVYGDMEIKSNSNINKIYSELNNTSCTQEIPQIQTSGSSFVKCDIKQDPNTYLITSNNIETSTPIHINLNKDKTISLNLLSFNTFGYPTKNYTLTYCNFNIQTFAFIEKITNTLGTFMINMICFEETLNNTNPKNKLDFNVELISYPNNFVKNNSVFEI